MSISIHQHKHDRITFTEVYNLDDAIHIIRRNKRAVVYVNSVEITKNIINKLIKYQDLKEMNNQWFSCSKYADTEFNYRVLRIAGHLSQILNTRSNVKLIDHIKHIVSITFKGY